MGRSRAAHGMLMLGVLSALVAGGSPSFATGGGGDAVIMVEPSGRWHVPRPGFVDYTFTLGRSGDVPLLGDWDGDGIDTPGLYRPADGSAHLTNRIPPHNSVDAPLEVMFFFGVPGDRVFAGDWDGDGVDTLGLSRRGRVFLADSNATTIAERVFWFGTHTDVPFAGDPDGNGRDGIFLRRAASASVFYTNDPSDGPIAESSGSLYFGLSNDRVVFGDWNDDGTDTPGAFRPFSTMLYLHNFLWTGTAQHSYRLGRADWTPLAGNLAHHVGTTAPVAPLTGRVGGDASQRVVIAKISNSSKARPQAGISQSDMVMEVIVEGGVGRWLAFYQTRLPGIVGPLRSVREVDPKLIEPFDARVLHSGGQPSVRAAVDRVAVDEGNGRIPGYYRDPDRRRVYDLMYDFEDLPDDGWEGTVTPVLPFDPWIPHGGIPATTVDVAMTRVNTLRWDWAGGRYLRSQGDQPSVDADGARITADTVVVIFVEQLDTGRRDSAGQPVPDYQVVGSGDAVVFRNGQAWPVRWERDTTAGFFGFVREDGREVPMDPGRTWIHVTPTTGSVDWR